MKRILCLAILFAGCNVDRAVETQLMPLKDCTDVESAIRQIALKDMNHRMDEALERSLQYGSGGYCWGLDISMEMDGAGNGAPTKAGAPQTSNGEANQVSGTNNQVLGVDEADFVKNDKKYIYILTEKSFRIINAWPPEQANEIAKVSIEGEPLKLYVYNDRALIYSSLEAVSSQKVNESYPGDYYGNRECTYGYSCSFTGDGHPTKITVLDISNVTAPTLVREIVLSGSYVNARRVGHAVYTVLSSPAVLFREVRYYPDDFGYCGSNMSWWETWKVFEKLRAENKKIILTASLENLFPSAIDTIHVGENAGKSTQLLAECNGFYLASIADGGQFTTLLSLDMTKETTVDAATIISRPGAVYASGEALYVAVPHERYDNYGWYPGMEGQEQASSVHKFLLNKEPVLVNYAASGVVKGKVLNQFSMDEKDGYLRIATTSGHVPDPNVHSTLTVLGQTATTLETEGLLDKLAPQEDIRS
ncbi:MAG: beta-propeller domain-containing protein, partial [Pseudomonadota bacterium]